MGEKFNKCRQCGEIFPEYFPECPKCGEKVIKDSFVDSVKKKPAWRFAFYVLFIVVALPVVLQTISWNQSRVAANEARAMEEKKATDRKKEESRREADIRAAENEKAEAKRKAALPCGIEPSAWDGSVRPVKEFIEKNLPDKKSFEAIEWSKVLSTGQDECVVRLKFRAKNGFGGYVIENKLFSFDRSGRVTGMTNVK